MYDIAIIGAGPAGASAALFAAKAGKKTILFDSGKSMTARAWLENHYGAPEITGPDLLSTGVKQATKFGTELKEEEVSNINEVDGDLELVTDNGTYTAKHVIFATGVNVSLAEKIGIRIIDGKEPRIKNVIEVDNDGKTNKVNIWAAGTVAGESVHTIITAGHGAKVAVNVLSELNGERYVDHDILK